MHKPVVITSCKVFLFELPLTVPLRLGGQPLYSRAGFIICIGAASGHCGYGEVAPLPGLHREDLEMALQQYQEIYSELVGYELPQGLYRLQGSFERWLGPYSLCPSLRYGIEMAVLNLLACIEGRSLAGLLASDYRKTVSVNGLLIGEEPVTVARQARALVADGYTSIKLKVGRLSIAQDIALVKTTRKTLGSTCSLRLDANRSWDLPAAISFAKGIADCKIEFIEEPLAEVSQLSDFYAITLIPVALDESLVEQTPVSIAIPQGVAAFVLKPSVIGGLEKTAQFLRTAKEFRLKAVISSVFDSAVGLAALANCAAALGEWGLPMGLDTYRWLREDLTETAFTASRARIAVDSVHRQAQQLRASLLQQPLDFPGFQR